MRDQIQIMIQIIAERVKKDTRKALSLGAISEDQCNKELDRIAKLEGQIVKEARKMLHPKKTRKTRLSREGH
jgi:ribosome recycling factor